MRSALAVAALLGLAALVIAAALDGRDRAFATGLPASEIGARLDPGGRACAGGVDVPASFQRVRLVVGTFERPGPPLRVTLIDEATGGRAGGGQVAGGYPDNTNVETAVGDVPAGGRLRVCVANEGEDRVAVFGARPNREQDVDPELAVVFVREPPATMLALVPDAFERSARFKAAWIGPWTMWVLLAIAALAVPAALARALSAAYASERSSSRSRDAAASDRSS